MNVGSIGVTAYQVWEGSRADTSTKNVRNHTFAQTMENQGADTNLVLHGLSEKMKEQGFISVGSWVDARTGISTSVYKAYDFDEKNPLYLVKTWDAQGNVTEKEVNMNEIDPKACNVYEMYAYSCYLSDTGKYVNAQTAFMKSLPAGNDMSQFGIKSRDSIYTEKVDWIDIIKGWMDMQYRSGNMKGYLDYKGFYDFILTGI